MSAEPQTIPADLGGSSLGSAFFGWLVATGMTVILLGLAALVISLAGIDLGAEGLTALEELGIVGGIVFLVILMTAYFAGGYVAGRLARFNGARAGFGVWAIAGLLSILLAVLGALLGSQFQLQIELPSIPVPGGTLAAGGFGALVVSSLVTLVASVLGGRFGNRFHKRIDRRLVEHASPQSEPVGSPAR